MGFDASVISGVVKFIEPEFGLSKLELGWGVASLSLTATFAMMVSGPLSDRFGRKAILKLAAILFTVSAIGSALAPSFIALVIARMIGGLGVGAALIIAPMYIAEISPAHLRGRMVSLNQLNIVLGISIAFFSNYMILQLANSDSSWVTTLGIKEGNWRWMLGLETLPAAIYFACLFFVPESPRWLVMKNRLQDAYKVMQRTSGSEQAQADIELIQHSITHTSKVSKVPVSELFKPAMRLVMIIGVSIAILQQITGINAVFFYAPMIFEISGLGTDAAFMQAILVGVTNVVFTLLAISLIDKLGRKLLLGVGVSGIAICMFTLAFGFKSATYTLSEEAMTQLPSVIDTSLLISIQDQTFDNELDYKDALRTLLGEQITSENESGLVSAAISINQTLILASILGFVACFAMSLGPVMWVLFSELFPNQIRGIAISFVGLINSGVSFLVQFIFPWELSTLGSTLTFAIYGVFAVIGLVVMMIYLPETKGKSLEDLEKILIKT